MGVRRPVKLARESVSSKPDSETRLALLAATEECLHRYGYAGLSTRRVAEAANMPLSQIHYHFGSKEALVLALLDYQNRQLLERQRATFTADLPLWKRWEKACDYLDEDLASGYVRVLQEMMAAGWSNPDIAAAVRNLLGGWYALLGTVAREATVRFGGLGPLRSDDVACLVGNAFLGCEAMLLLGFEEQGMPIRRALRRFGTLIRRMEEGAR
ncbi:MAG: TetR/AcrR family transcriptional regulator [Rhodospirillum sp.]|nr:TetR/AcrR family transcriptional regulator [Rhodospirillum sp.]